MSVLPADRELRAAEYVLGLLYSAEMRAVERECEDDPGLAHSIGRWEERFSPLANAVTPVEPPAELWDRIENDLPGDRSAPAAQPVAVEPVAPPPPFVIASPVAQKARPAPAPRPSLWNNVTLWRSSAMGGLALAAVLALFLLVPPSAPEQFHAAIVATNEPNGMWMAETMPDGSIKLTAMAPVAHPPDRDLELWAQPKGAPAPIAMGTVPASGVMTVAGHDMPMDGLKLMISLEPRGGSPTGAPSGPVLYEGTMSAVERS